MRIRKIEPRDFAKVAELENKNWTSLSTPVIMASTAEKIMEKVLKGTTYFLAVNDEDTEILGILDSHVRHGVIAGAHVITFGLMTDELARHQGVAHELLAHFLDYAKSEDFRKVSIEVLGDNPVAQHLYESFGFVLEGREKEEFYLDGHYVDNLHYAYFL